MPDVSVKLFALNVPADCEKPPRLVRFAPRDKEPVYVPSIVTDLTVKAESTTELFVGVPLKITSSSLSGRPSGSIGPVCVQMPAADQFVRAVPF